ncbi:MAG: M48 family metalloprotease [Candidatus Gracilibacteria bacterium]
MAIIGLQTSKTQNNLRVVFLISLLPLLVFLCLLIFYTMTNKGIAFQESIYMSGMTVLYTSPLILLWLIIGVTLQKSLIFNFTGAREIQRKDNPDIYNLVENLCISRGLPVPKIGIIDDDSMNAFATGWSPKNSYIVFSKGLIEKLDKREIEAVAGHELTHIMNGDVKTMVITNVFIGIIGTIGYILMRTRGEKNPFIILGLFLYLLSLILLPLINLAISRKKEFLADAGSVELTKDKDSMIKALQKISTDARIEYIDGKSSTVSSMFIYSPKSNTKSYFSFISNMMSTHPPIEERIELLQKY